MFCHIFTLEIILSLQFSLSFLNISNAKQLTKHLCNKNSCTLDSKKAYKLADFGLN